MTCATYACHTRKPETDSMQISLDFCGLLRGSESIQFVVWKTSPGLSFVTQMLPPDHETVSAVVTGGEAGNTYKVCAEVHTSTGQIDQRCALVAVYTCFVQPTDPSDAAFNQFGSHTLFTGGSVITPVASAGFYSGAALPFSLRA